VAHCEIATPAFVANKIVSTVPANTDALACFPIRNAVACKIDNSRDFMTRDARIFDTGPQTFLYERVAVTNAARFDFDPNLSRTGLRNFAIDDFEIAAGFADLRDFHNAAM
jgi:hypothetical protein